MHANTTHWGRYTYFSRRWTHLGQQEVARVVFGDVVPFGGQPIARRNAHTTTPTRTHTHGVSTNRLCFLTHRGPWLEYWDQNGMICIGFTMDAARRNPTVQALKDTLHSAGNTSQSKVQATHILERYLLLQALRHKRNAEVELPTAGAARLWQRRCRRPCCGAVCQVPWLAVCSLHVTTTVRSRPCGKRLL